MPLLNDPWLLALVSAPIGVLIGLILFYLIGYIRKQRAKIDLMSRVNNADEFLKSDEATEALLVYEDVLGEVSEAQYRDIYAHIKNNQGMCYGKLALIMDKEKSLTKAIRAFEEALKIRTVEKYPVNYATTQNNLGNAYRDLAQVRNKEENLTKAIKAFEEALKIYTVEKYPAYYELVVSNMSRVKHRMKGEHQ